MCLVLWGFAQAVFILSLYPIFRTVHIEWKAKNPFFENSI